MPSFYDQLPSAIGGGFYDQLPSIAAQRAPAPQFSIEDIYRSELANAIARADAMRANREFAVDPATGFYPLNPQGQVEAIPAPGFSEEEIARSAFSPVREMYGRSPSSYGRVFGSASRGYFQQDPYTGGIMELVPPSEQPSLNPVERVKLQAASREQSRLRSLLDKPEYADLPNPKNSRAIELRNQKRREERRRIEDQINQLGQEIDAYGRVFSGGAAESDPEPSYSPFQGSLMDLPPVGQFQDITTGGPMQFSSPSAQAQPAQTAIEVIRLTPDGRRAVFNSQTKEFLRYAD